MWSRKPRSLLGKGTPGYILVMSAGLPLLLLPGFGVLLAAAWYVATFVAFVRDRVRSARWRREYEVSIVRVIRSSRKVR
jgi:hypothetical protein